MKISQGDYYKEVLANILNKVESQIIQCHNTQCEWLGSQENLEVDESDGSLLCPRCGHFCVSFVRTQIPPYLYKDIMTLREETYL